jgi:cell division transport system permease protein
MGRLWFFTQDAFRALRRNAAPSMAAIVTTVVTVVLLGVLIPIFQATQAKSEDIRDQLEFRVSVYDDATQAELAQLRQRLAEIPNVESLEFVTKAEALRELTADLDDDSDLRESIAQLNGENPLPANFIVRADDAAHLDTVRQAIGPVQKGRGAPIAPIVQDVFDRSQQREEIEEVTCALKIVLTVITALLVVASLMLVGNTIRLSIYARRREVEVMRLVGATRWFVRWPFMIEGVVVGFLGGVVAILVLWLGKVTIVDPLSDRFAFMAAQDTMSFGLLVMILFAAAIFVSAIGSGVTLRRFLRV